MTLTPSELADLRERASEDDLTRLEAEKLFAHIEAVEQEAAIRARDKAADDAFYLHTLIQRDNARREIASLEGQVDALIGRADFWKASYTALYEETAPIREEIEQRKAAAISEAETLVREAGR